MESKKVYLNAVVRGTDFDQDQREFDFIITTDKRDSHGTVFESDGWDFDQYKENPVVFYQHRSNSNDPDDLVGITIKGPWQETLADGSKAWVARVRFESEEINPKAEKIRKKIIAGTLRMASIGAHIFGYRYGDPEKGENKDDLFFTEQRLFEWSIVNIGSNPGAKLQRAKDVADEIRLEDLEKEKPAETGETTKTKVRSVAAAQLELYKHKF